MNISAVSHAGSHYPALSSAASARPGQEAFADKAETGLTDEELKQVETLKARDREVRAHEQAHLAAAGGLAMSGANYTYQRGPDGVNYAIGGDVKIDTSPGRTPEETIQRARIIRAAALAPAEPSGQDRAVAAKAAQMENQARSEQAAGNEGQNGSEAGWRPDATRLQRYYGLGNASVPGGQVDIQA